MSTRFFFTAGVAASLLLLVGCGVSPDVERSQLRAALQRADGLATEIESWRKGVGAQIGADVTKSIEGFQARAESVREEIDDLSDDAVRGLDLAGVRQALVSLEDFPTDTFTDAAAPARLTMLDQLKGRAEALRVAVARVTVPQLTTAPAPTG
jgi:hypothetical protein